MTAHSTDSPSANGPNWRFPPFTLWESERRLDRDGAPAEPLDRSAYEVLRHLLANAGEVCTQEELLQVGWPGRVVTANSLAQCISRLRKALGEQSADLLKVVHRFGYRLVAEVRYVPGEAAAHPGADARTILVAGQQVPSRPAWTLRRRLGVGSCGEVWLAEDATGQQRAYKLTLTETGLRSLKREVALHRMLAARPQGIDSADPLRDWNLEQTPFFVAADFHADGNLAEWSRDGGRLQQLSVAARLQLAIRLCHAVADLHEADIAHRDLKPENLYPVPHPAGGWHITVGDLGIAAGTLPPGVDASGLPLGQLTMAGETVSETAGSALYLAPETLTGQPATSLSDIYALGVLVYQLMIGDLRRAISPGWQADLPDPLLVADIELAANIDPSRRLLTARQLAERLEQLPDRHVEATRQRVAEQERAELARRLQRSRRRWRIGVAFAALMGVGVAASSWFAWQAEAARRVADLRLDEANAVRGFLTEQLLAQANPYDGADRDVRLKDALDVSASQVDARFANSPETAAEVHRMLARLYEGWAQYPQALRHQQAALALLKDRREADPSLALAERLLCLYARRAGQTAQAQEACSRAAAIDTALFGAPSPATEVAQAKLDYEAGRCERVAERLGMVIGTGTSTVEPSTLADALWFRGLCLARLGQFTDSRRDFEALIPLSESLHGADNPELGWALMDFAESSIIAGDFALAQPLLTRAERIFAERLGPDHADTQVAHYHRARMAHWGGDPAKAVPLFRKALDHWSASLGDDHLWSLFTRAELGWALAQVGERTAALEALKRSQALAADKLKDNPSTRSFFRETWLRTHLALGNMDAAEAELPRLRDDLAAGVPRNHPRWALADCLEAEIALDRGQTEPARTALARCEAGLESALAGLPAENYRRAWAAEVRRKLDSPAHHNTD